MLGVMFRSPRTRALVFILGALALLGWLGYEWWTAPRRALLWHLKDAPEARERAGIVTRGTPGADGNAWPHYLTLADPDRPASDKTAALEGLINSTWCRTPAEHHLAFGLSTTRLGERVSPQILNSGQDTPVDRWRYLLLLALVHWDFQTRDLPSTERPTIFVAEPEWDYERGARLLDSVRPPEELVQPIIEALCADFRHHVAWWFHATDSEDPLRRYFVAQAERGPWFLLGREAARGAYIAESIRNLRRRLAHDRATDPESAAELADRVKVELKIADRGTAEWVAYAVVGELRGLAISAANHGLLRIAWACAWHRTETGAFPRDVDSLVPKYLPEVPWFPRDCKPALEWSDELTVVRLTSDSRERTESELGATVLTLQYVVRGPSP